MPISKLLLISIIHFWKGRGEALAPKLLQGSTHYTFFSFVFMFENLKIRKTSS